MTHWLWKIWQFAIGKITSQELLTDPDCAIESVKFVSTSRTSSHARDGVFNIRENSSTISSFVLLLGLISRLPTNELRVATNAKNASESITIQLRCPRISYDAQECPRNLVRTTHDFSNRGIRGQSFLGTVQNFWAEFPIDLRIARTVYGLCESVKVFTNWVRFSHESKYLSIRGNSWDSWPVWNRGISCIHFIFSSEGFVGIYLPTFKWRFPGVPIKA